MKKRHSTKRALLISFISLILCISMLAGSTFAWFTDSVSSDRNVITAGNLDVELYHADKATGEAGEIVDGDTVLFDDVDSDLWEPGAMAWEIFTVKNAGTLALKYQFALNALDATVIDGISFASMLKVAVVDADFEYTREKVAEIPESQWKNIDAVDLIRSTRPLLEGESDTFGIIIWWKPSEIDNTFNMNNGKSGEVKVDVGITLNATQAPYEEDAFDSNYDETAGFPSVSNSTISAPIPGVDANNQLTESVDLTNACGNGPSAYVPENVVVEDGATELTLNVNPTAPVYNIQMTDGQAQRVLNVKIEGVSKDNTTPMVVNLGPVFPVGLKTSSIQLYHIENDTPVLMTCVDTFTAHNQFTYDKDTGAVSIYVANFSEFVFISDPSDPWNGTEDETWKATVKATYNEKDTFEIDSPEKLAALGTLVAEGYDFAGKTVKITQSLDLGGHSANPKTFYPIGYRYSEDNTSDEPMPFRGTFDAKKNETQCYRIFHLSQSTWSIKGHYDGSYYKASLGLFAYLDGATVQNVIIEHFELEGEFAPTGCIAGRGNGGTFNNIKLYRNDIATYNTGVGGIIGWDWGLDVHYNFNKIEIDDTNYIRALWGSWDVGCGGIMGFLDDQCTATMTDCTVAAKLDVFNDVCANYQYYQYRYSGMLIGTIGWDGIPESENLTCSNVKVYLGDWTNYYYCEFEKNTGASYTEDFQFSRVDEKDIVFDLNGKPVSCTHTHTKNEDKLACYLPFSQLYTGYKWGAKAVFEHPGVEVLRYKYTITYFDGTHTVGADYILDNSVDFTSLKEIKVSSEYQDHDHTYEWVDVTGNTVTSIPAGTDRNVMLYVNTKEKNMIRFVDKDGFVIHEQDFVPGKSLDYYHANIQEPAVPAVPGYYAAWPVYDLWLKDAKEGEDVVVHPIYSVDPSFDRGDILDKDFDLSTLFKLLSQGEGLTMYQDLSGDFGSSNIKTFATIVSSPQIAGDNKARLDLDSFTLTMSSNANGNQDWTLFRVLNNNKFTLGSGLSGSGTLTFVFNSLNGNATPCVFKLDAGGTLVLERGVTVELKFAKSLKYFQGRTPTINSLIQAPQTINADDYEGLYFQYDLSGTDYDVIRLVVTGTTTIVGATTTSGN